MRTFLALIAAALAPTILLVALYLAAQFPMFPADDPYIWVRVRPVAFFSFAISSAFVFVLGFPAFLVLRRFSTVRLGSILLIGFLLPAATVGALTLPSQFGPAGSSSTVNGIPMMIDGVTTAAGWLEFFQDILLAGGLGFLSAVTFWLVWRGGSNSLAKRTAAPELE